MFDFLSFSFHCVPELAGNIEVCLEKKLNIKQRHTRALSARKKKTD